MQDGVVVKGLAPRRLDPARYYINPTTDLNELEKGMPWRSIQDEFGKFKWIDHSGRVYHGTPFSVEPDVTSKHVFIASMMHTSMRSPVLQDKPDVTCPSDCPISDNRREVVHNNYRGWRRVGRTGGEPGGNRGRTGGARKNRGRTGGIWEENRGRTGGFWYSFTKSTGGEAGALGQEPGENRGEGISFETRDPTRDLKINEQDRP